MSKIRILHFFGKMDRGGAESLIVNILKYEKNKNYQNDFCVNSSSPGVLDDVIEQYGSKIHYIPIGKNLLEYVISVRKLLIEEEYDVVHSHVHYFSGINLLIARYSNIKIRIAHSHTYNPNKRNITRLVYESIMKCAIDLFGTHYISCSQKASEDLYFSKNKNVKIIFNGINTKKFYKSRKEIRTSDENNKLKIVHIGAFRDEKNHRFLIDVITKLSVINNDFHLYLLGSGPLLENIKKIVFERNLSENVIFIGDTDQVDRYLEIADIFVLPSKYEGLGIAAIEAQVSGVYCLVSEKLPQEIIITKNIKRLPINAGTLIWVKELLSRKDVVEYDLLYFMQFDIINTAQKIFEIYSLANVYRKD